MKILNFKKVRAECGHIMRLYDKITIIRNGNPVKIGITFKSKTPSHCHYCFEKMLIRCASCGDTIKIGELIGLISPKEGLKNPDYTTFYDGKMIVCSKRKCCRDGLTLVGNWMIPGKVELAYPEKG